jgi:hypothetical protein
MEMDDEMVELEVLGKKRTILIGDRPVGFIVRDILASLGDKWRIFVIVTDSNIASLFLTDFVKAFAEASVLLKTKGGNEVGNEK